MKWPFGTYNKLINQLNLSIMKRSLVLVAGAVLAAAAVSAFVYMNNERNSMSDLFNANVEALTQNEGVTTIPCVKAASICLYTVKDANGEYYNASTSGMRNYPSI